MTSIDLAQMIAQVNRLEGRITASLPLLASKSDIQLLTSKLDGHLSEHSRASNTLRRMWLVVFGSVVAGVAPYAIRLFS